MATLNVAYPRPALAAQEVRQLTLFKWRYTLESTGFTRQQSERLLFWKWMVQTGRVTP